MDQHHPDHGGSTLSRTALTATLHCLTGCAIGEVLGMIVSAWLGLSNAASIGISIVLAFASDTLSIGTMEIVDNAFVALVPGALAAGLTDGLFWWSLAVSLVIAFAAAFPVNRWLIARGKGHAVVHAYHGHAG